MCSIDLEPAELWEERPRVARKVRKCSMCRGVITAGEPYVAHFSKHDGNITSNSKCQLCCEIVDDFLDDHGSHGTPEYMDTLLDECVNGLVYHPETAKWQLAILQMEQRKQRAQELVP